METAPERRALELAGNIRNTIAEIEASLTQLVKPGLLWDTVGTLNRADTSLEEILADLQMADMTTNDPVAMREALR